MTFRPVIDWLADRTGADALAAHNIVPLGLAFLTGVVAGLAVAWIA